MARCYTTTFFLQPHCNGHQMVRFSPDVQYIASGGDDQTVQIWRADTKEQFLILRHHGQQVRTVGWSPDSQFVRASSWESFVEWDITDGQEVMIYHRPNMEKHSSGPI